MDFSISLFLQVATYIASVGVIYGGLSARLRELEKKMDRHNKLMEDMAAAKISICKLENQVDRIETRMYDKTYELGGYM